MSRIEVLLGVGVLLIAAVAGPVAALPSDRPAGPAAQVDENRTAADNGSAVTPVAPGAQFSGAVEVTQAEVDGEVEGRSFGIAVARAASNDSKAAVVGDRVQSLRDRLADLREREQRLTEQYEAGEMSESRYRAEVAGIAARSEVLARQANATRNASEGIPNEALAARGVDADAIETVRRDASAMTGPEVAEIARTVGGPGVGGGLGDARRGPPEGVPGQSNRDDPGPPSVDRGDGGQASTPTDAMSRTPPRSGGPNRTAVGPPESPESRTPGGNGQGGSPERGPPGQSADPPRGGDGGASDGDSDDRDGNGPSDRADDGRSGDGSAGDSNRGGGNSGGANAGGGGGGGSSGEGGNAGGGNSGSGDRGGGNDGAGRPGGRGP